MKLRVDHLLWIAQTGSGLWVLLRRVVGQRLRERRATPDARSRSLDPAQRQSYPIGLARRVLMSTAWQLQDATNRFSEVVEEALQSGPQTVTRRGEPVVVVVAIDTWRRVSGAAPNLKAFLRAAPLDGVDLSRDVGERSDVVLP